MKKSQFFYYELTRCRKLQEILIDVEVDDKIIFPLIRCVCDWVIEWLG